MQNEGHHQERPGLADRDHVGGIAGHVLDMFQDPPILFYLIFEILVMPLMEVEGSAGAFPFLQIGPIVVNVGVICWSMVISIVETTPHCPASGVNV